MKKLIILLMVVGCARTEVKPEKPAYIPRAERIKTCVNDFIIKDVKPVDAFRICNGIYRGEL